VSLSTSTKRLLCDLSACFDDTEKKSDSLMDLFEIETDIMKWTRPFGIPLRLGWHLSRYVHNTVTSFAFLIEGRESDELPERIVAGVDIVGIFTLFLLSLFLSLLFVYPDTTRHIHTHTHTHMYI